MAFNREIRETRAKKNLKFSAYEAQFLINYLKAPGLEVGLLINFGERMDIK